MFKIRPFFVLIIAIHLFYSNLNAQERGIAVGVEGGVIWGGLQVMPQNESFKASISQQNLGVSVLYPFGQYFAFRSGVFFLNEKGDYMWDIVNDENNSMKRNYAAYEEKSINLPLIFRISFGKRLRFFLEDGIVPGYAYRSVLETESVVSDSNGMESSPENFVRLDSPYFRTLISLRLGINFAIRPRIMLEAGAGALMTTKRADAMREPDFKSGKTSLPLYMSIYYRL